MSKNTNLQFGDKIGKANKDTNALRILVGVLGETATSKVTPEDEKKLDQILDGIQSLMKDAADLVSDIEKRG